MYIYIVNNSGPRMDPCGAPTLMSKVSDVVSSNSVYCLQLFK